MLVMKCPGCASILETPAEVCPTCKFTLRRLDPKFGTVPLHTRYLTDRSSSLTLDEVERLRDLLERFETKFPQSVFSVFVTDLPAGTNIREFTFWLANRARFASVDAIAAQNFDVLLVIDAETHNAALTVGYGLEKFISEDDLNAALTGALPALRDGELERGIRLCIEEMTKQLTDICKATSDGSERPRAFVAKETW
jgi:uncharacterized membrane protein YgcG